MKQKKKTYFNWSSGKDAALALHKLQQDQEFNVDRLLTSINNHYGRVSMHGLRRELLMRQIEAIGLPVSTIELPAEPSMEEYAEKMKNVVSTLKSEGYTHTAFGDIFLEDLRKYREEQLNPFEIQCVFPLWKMDTKEVITEFLNLGFRAIVVCVNANLLDSSFVGRELSEDFINELPANVDPCGENGEFHTFCFDGPIFKKPIKFEIGEKTYKEYKSPKKDKEDGSDENLGFWFCDLQPIDHK